MMIATASVPLLILHNAPQSVFLKECTWPRPEGFSHVRILTNDRSLYYLSAETVALFTGCQVASGLYAAISLAIWSVLEPRSF